MNPTHPQDNHAPEPHLPSDGSRFFDLLDTVPDGVGIRARLSAAIGDEPVPGELQDYTIGYFRTGKDGFPSLVRKPAVPDDEPDRYTLTDAGHAALDTPASDEPVAWVAVRGWCEVCGQALPWACTWDEPLCSDCVIVARPDIRPGVAANGQDSGCRCGDSGCADTFGRITRGQDRSGCCQYCGYFSCDVCGWTAEGQGTSPGTAGPTSSCPVDLVTETDDETTARVLRSAATYLERHGWIQGAYYDATAGVFTPPACMVGAIGMVCYGGPVDAPAQHFDDPGFLDFEAAVLHLDRYLLAENGSESYEFNDARGRRADDVVRVLRDAAAWPAHELIDALKAIDQQNTDMAALAELLVPSGAFGQPSGSEVPARHTDSPHQPGNRYDCPACEAECFCNSLPWRCVYCARRAPQKPSRCPSCDSNWPGSRNLVGDGSSEFAPCENDWHDGDSDGGDAR